MARSGVRSRQTHLRTGYRVEAADTVDHWPALYLARADIPLVRGWFRQDDRPVAALLYRPFTAAEYVAWGRTGSASPTSS